MINNLTKISYDTPYSRRMKQSVDFEMTECAKKSADGKIMKKDKIIKREPANVNFCGLFSNPNAMKFYKSKFLTKTLEFAEQQQLVFSAVFALALTGIFRPAAIMTLPGKKNQDDKKYASAHSIASGVIGFILSSIIFTPVSDAINELKNNPKPFIEKESYLFKNPIAFDRAKVYLDRIPDILTAVPKGILTVALIPPILKYVFGMEKQKAEVKEEPYVFQSYALLNFNGVQNDNKNVFQNFMGRAK